VRLVAKPGKENELEQFLAGALPLANQEPATIAWFAIKLNAHEFGIFDVFPDDPGRQAHVGGPIAAALFAKAPELLAKPPQIEQVDVLASKLPART
jgi:quinol monooxygenase YgiN